MDNEIMSLTSTLLINRGLYLLLGVIVAMILAAMLVQIIAIKQKHHPQKRLILTPQQQEFYKNLLNTASDHFVFPEVAVSALISTGLWSHMRRRRVDFVICTRDYQPVCLILNHPDDELTKFLTLAGYRVLTSTLSHKPTADDIFNKIT